MLFRRPGAKIIDLFKLNNVAMHRLAHDTTLDLQMYYIGDFKTAAAAVRRHYLHSNVKLNPVNMKVNFMQAIMWFIPTRRLTVILWKRWSRRVSIHFLPGTFLIRFWAKRNIFRIMFLKMLPPIC